jgi:threonine dehydrogenase-like Zn-dependent dehydrogenase
MVYVKTAVSTISAGTERANITGDPNTNAYGASKVKFPRASGYNSAGTVLAAGEGVEFVKPGDLVVVYWGKHQSINAVTEDKVVKIEDDATSFETGALSFIATFPLAAIRKTRLELGESAMVMGLGLLGMSAVQFCRLSGAYPLIAVDLNPTRRQLALELGADYALDPADPDFVRQVKEITGGKGVNACVEVTGVSAAMHQALECAATQGRISLLGCTRTSDCSVDYYQLVHKPGVKLIGAHNFIRPKVESYPHHWTHEDDCQAILRFIASGRFRVKPMISRVVAPEQCPDIFHQLATDPNFPLGTVFDWRNCK